MKTLSILLFMALNSSLLAQVGNENVSFSTGTFFMRGSKSVSKDYKVEGKPYIDGEEFRKVIIKGYQLELPLLRYNAYEDEMEFKKEDGIYFVNKENLLKIEFPELKKTYQCLDYSVEGKKAIGYLLVLYEGKLASLFKREKVELLKGEKSPNAYSKDANDYFAKQKDVYYIGRGNEFYKFPKNISAFTKLFSLDAQEVAQYIKTNKINFNKEEGMIKMLTFVNQY